MVRRRKNRCRKGSEAGIKVAVYVAALKRRFELAGLRVEAEYVMDVSDVRPVYIIRFKLLDLNTQIGWKYIEADYIHWMPERWGDYLRSVEAHLQSEGTEIVNNR
jgi:hypothetical protein